MLNNVEAFERENQYKSWEKSVISLLLQSIWNSKVLDMNHETLQEPQNIYSR